MARPALQMLAPSVDTALGSLLLPANACLRGFCINDFLVPSEK